ncbi:MAG: hypothetical protein WBC53_02655, partial [Phycisphaerae bacterium]
RPDDGNRQGDAASADSSGTVFLCGHHRFLIPSTGSGQEPPGPALGAASFSVTPLAAARQR